MFTMFSISSRFVIIQSDSGELTSKLLHEWIGKAYAYYEVRDLVPTSTANQVGIIMKDRKQKSTADYAWTSSAGGTSRPLRAWLLACLSDSTSLAYLLRALI